MQDYFVGWDLFGFASRNHKNFLPSHRCCRFMLHKQSDFSGILHSFSASLVRFPLLPPLRTRTHTHTHARTFSFSHTLAYNVPPPHLVTPLISSPFTLTSQSVHIVFVSPPDLIAPSCHLFPVSSPILSPTQHVIVVVVAAEGSTGSMPATVLDDCSDVRAY